MSIGPDARQALLQNDAKRLEDAKKGHPLPFALIGLIRLRLLLAAMLEHPQHAVPLYYLERKTDENIGDPFYPYDARLGMESFDAILQSRVFPPESEDSSH
jgi:hypothetical protein